MTLQTLLHDKGYCNGERNIPSWNNVLPERKKHSEYDCDKNCPLYVESEDSVVYCAGRVIGDNFCIDDNASNAERFRLAKEIKQEQDKIKYLENLK
jgi:hypothetical protein